MKAAVIGAGAIARQHLACLRTLPGVEVVAVCDLSPAVAESVAERFGVANWFTSHEDLLSKMRPEIVHVTTPPGSHYPLALAALQAGAHAIVEKPIASHPAEVAALITAARENDRVLVEDYNYLFNAPIRRIADYIAGGDFGIVTHVDAFICVDVSGEPVARPPHTQASTDLPGGPISDYVPHLAALAHHFVGTHRSVDAHWRRTPGSLLPHDELRALVTADRGSALLGFSARAQPDAFWVQVYGTRMRAVANLYAGRLTVDRVRAMPRPLQGLVNSLDEARDVGRCAIGAVWHKLTGGPGTYDGLWHLLRDTYSAIERGSAPPVTPSDVIAVNALSSALHVAGGLA